MVNPHVLCQAHLPSVDHGQPSREPTMVGSSGRTGSGARRLLRHPRTRTPVPTHALRTGFGRGQIDVLHRQDGPPTNIAGLPQPARRSGRRYVSTTASMGSGPRMVLLMPGPQPLHLELGWT